MYGKNCVKRNLVLKIWIEYHLELFSVHGNCLGQKSDKSGSLMFSVCITFIEFV